MTGLSRCGKRYPTFDDAYKSAKLRAGKSGRKYVISSCWAGDHWHVTEPDSPLATAKPYRPDPFPPAVQKLIDARDEGLCQGCGRAGRLERHHRRLKSMGGSKARSHTQCACNGLSLCRRCHEWAHLNPGQAREFGVIVRKGIARPGSLAVTRWLNSDPDDLAADEQWLTCDGRWVHSPSETED